MVTFLRTGLPVEPGICLLHNSFSDLLLIPHIFELHSKGGGNAYVLDALFCAQNACHKSLEEDRVSGTDKNNNFGIEESKNGYSAQKA